MRELHVSWFLAPASTQKVGQQILPVYRHFQINQKRSPNDIQCYLREYCAVVLKADPKSFVAVGITPGDAWATARDKLGIDGKQLEAGYEIMRISEEQYRAFTEEQFSSLAVPIFSQMPELSRFYGIVITMYPEPGASMESREDWPNRAKDVRSIRISLKLHSFLSILAKADA